MTVIFIISMLCTISSFREIPLRLLESDEMMKPLTQMAVKKEKERIKALEGGKAIIATTATVISEKKLSNGSSNGSLPSIEGVPKTKTSSSSISSSSDDDEDENEDSHVTFVSSLQSQHDR